MVWQELEFLPVERLWPARVQLHWALQPLAAVGKLLLHHEPDFSEQSFRWSDDEQCLCQARVSAPSPFRAALRLSPPALLLLTDAEASPREMALSGLTLDEAYAWVESQTTQLVGTSLLGRLERPSGLPDHPFAHGTAFEATDFAAFRTLRQLYGDADLVLSAWAQQRAEPPSVRCWPHHFDLAVLLALELAPDGEPRRSLGLGLVPGDEARREPYVYVTPWPRPEVGSHPPLPSGGIWNTEGWFGAVLPLSALGGLKGGAQQAAVAEFLRVAGQHCEDLARQLPLESGTDGR